MNLDALGRRVVIADNDRAVLELMQIRLGLAGYDTYVERTGATALATVRRIRPAVLVLALNLPDLDGFDILKALHPRSTDGAFPILVIGHKLSSEHIQLAMSLGARDCMVKPFCGADILDRVGRLLRRPAAAGRPVALV